MAESRPKTTWARREEIAADYEKQAKEAKRRLGSLAKLEEKVGNAARVVAGKANDAAEKAAEKVNEIAEQTQSVQDAVASAEQTAELVARSKRDAAAATQAQAQLAVAYKEVAALLKAQKTLNADLAGAKKLYEEATDTHKLTSDMFRNVTEHELEQAFKRDSDALVKTETRHWSAVACVSVVLASMYVVAVIWGHWGSAIGFSAPFVLVLIALLRSLSEKRMLHADYEYKHSMVRATIGVKRSFPNKTKESWETLVRAMKKNPANRLRVNADVWIVMKEFLKRRAPKGADAKDAGADRSAP